MSTADTKDDAVDAVAMAATIDSGARPVTDSGADTLLAGPEDTAASIKSRSPDAEETADELLGTTLSERYEVTAKLGQGGMGAVYEAKHTVIGKRVALKVLLDKHAEKDQSVARLKQEARLASSIGHDNIIDITDFGTTDTGRTFVVMEYLEGESLGAVIAREGRLDTARVIRMAQQIASALAAAHIKGIVHRDIKPENIFVLQRDGLDFVKVLDFGISKSLVPAEEDARLTQTGMVMGTPLYMSPEQAQGDDDLDHRIDVYALGVILYESITGEVPFRGKNYLNILTQVISDEPTLPSEYFPEIDPNLESIICKAMAKDREDRYQSMEEFASDLAELDLVNPKSTSSRITAARWRRKKNGRSKRSYAMWMGAVALVAGGSVFGVNVLMADAPTTKERDQAMAAAVTYDAAPAVVPPDAAPAFVEAHIQLESIPPGATVYEGAVLEVCPSTPCTYSPPKTGDQYKLRVVHDGYLDGFLTVTPELHDGKTLPIKLMPVPVEPETSNQGNSRRHNKGHNKVNGGKTNGGKTNDGKTNGGKTNGGKTNGGGADTLGNPFPKE